MNQKIENILKKSIKEYRELKQLDCVISPSLPVVYFGDINEYYHSDIKIITAALNPSDIEFKKTKNCKPSFFRFPDYNGSCESLYLALNTYFVNEPYERWFGKIHVSKSGFLPVLNGLDSCYYNNSKNNIALHTDLCSPLATSPTWSKLKKEQKTLLRNHGYNLWKELVFELKPDLILTSFKKEYLNLLSLKYINTILSKWDKSKKNKYELIHYELKIFDFKTNLIWGSAQNTPLQPFKNKHELGRTIKNYLSF